MRAWSPGQSPDLSPPGAWANNGTPDWGLPQRSRGKERARRVLLANKTFRAVLVWPEGISVVSEKGEGEAGGREKKFSITLQLPAGDPSSPSLPGTVWPPVLGTGSDLSSVWRSLERRQPKINTQIVILGFSHSQITQRSKRFIPEFWASLMSEEDDLWILRASDPNLTFSKRAAPGSRCGRTERKRAPPQAKKARTWS